MKVNLTFKTSISIPPFYLIFNFLMPKRKSRTGNVHQFWIMSYRDSNYPKTNQSMFKTINKCPLFKHNSNNNVRISLLFLYDISWKHKHKEHTLHKIGFFILIITNILIIWNPLIKTCISSVTVIFPLVYPPKYIFSFHIWSLVIKL